MMAEQILHRSAKAPAGVEYCAAALFQSGRRAPSGDMGEDGQYSE